MSEEQKKRTASIETPTDKQLAWWLVWQVVEKFLRLAVLAGLIYGAWWWWTHRGT